MQKKLFIFVFCASLAQAASVDLHHATTTGLQQRPAIKAAHQAIAISTTQEHKATAAYLPQLSARHTTLFDREKSIEQTAHTLSLHGAQLIFDPAGPQLQRQIATCATARARHTFTATTHSAQHEIAHAFYDAWLLQEKAPLIAALRDLVHEEQKRVTLQHKVAQKNIHTLAQTQAHNAKRQADINGYEHEVEAAWALLQRLTGEYEVSTMPYLHYALDHGFQHSRSASTADTAKSGMTSQKHFISHLKPLQHYIDLALTLRPELKEKKEAHHEHTLAARQQRLGYLPRVSMQANLGKTFAGTTSSQGTDVNLSITASWNFFDGLQRSHAAHAADAAALRAQFEQHELRNTITQQVRTAYHKIASLQAASDAAHAAYLAEQGQWEQDRIAAELGSIDHVTLLKRAFSYHTAAHAWRAAHIALQKQHETLWYYCGYPHDRKQ